MENKEGLRIMIVMLLSIGLGFAMNAAETPLAVKVFYGGMKTLSETSDPTVIAQTQLNMQKCFYGYEDSGITLPNDFRFFDIDKKNPTHYNKYLPANSYIALLKIFLHVEKVMTINYQVKSNTLGGSVPELSGNRKAAVAAYVISIVEKKYSPENEGSRIFNDTVITFIETGMIGRIINNSSGRSSDDNVNSMRIKAAQFYEQKRYEEAYALYEKIVNIDPKDAASLYYIGLMTYWQRGCKKKYPKRAQAKKAATDYLNRAAYCSHSSRLTDKIEHVRTSIEYDGDILF